MSFTLSWNPPEIPTTKAILSYDVPYADKIHEGWARADGTSAPARPWVDAAVDEFTFVDWMIFSYLDHDDLSAAFRAMMWQFYDHLHEVLLDPRWDWDRITRRQDGSTVTSPRDIYDTGELYESQTLTFDGGYEDAERDA